MGLQDFNVEKLKVVNATKKDILQSYERKVKQMDTQNAIARSTAINSSRLEKVKARQEKMTMVAEESKKSIQVHLKNEAQTKTFITQLIVQGLLMLLENQVKVRCRACDEKLVQSCLAAAASEYARIMQAEAGSSKTVTLTIDAAVKLPPAPSGGHGASCLGGVVLACHPFFHHLVASQTAFSTHSLRLRLLLTPFSPRRGVGDN